MTMEDRIPAMEGTVTPMNSKATVAGKGPPKKRDAMPVSSSLSVDQESQQTVSPKIAASPESSLRELANTQTLAKLQNQLNAISQRQQQPNAALDNQLLQQILALNESAAPAPSTQDPLLSALLSSQQHQLAGATPGQQHQLNALEAAQIQQSPSLVERSIAQVLKEQLLLEEILRSPFTPNNPSSQISLQLLEQLQQQQQSPFTGNQNTTPAAFSLGLGLQSPATVDMLLASPKMSLLTSNNTPASSGNNPSLLARNSLTASIGAPPLFFDEKDSSATGDDTSKQDTQDSVSNVVATAGSCTSKPANPSSLEDKGTSKVDKDVERKLPPRKRRKIQFEADFPRHSSENRKATFPLPGTSKTPGQVAVSLGSFKAAWERLGKMSDKAAQREFFRRHLERKRGFSVKKAT